MNPTDRNEIAAEIEKLQEHLKETRERLVQLRHRLPEETVANHQFTGPGGATIHLSDMFGDKTDLIMIHNMGKSCPYCTLWADGFSGLVPHAKDRAAFVVVSPDPPEVQQEFAASRGWRFEMWSWHGSSFGRDMKMASEENKPWPGVSALQKKADGTIVRTGYDYFGPGDLYCPIWHFFELLPEGANKWEPRYSYE